MPDTEIVTGTIDSFIVKGPEKWQVVVKTPEAGQYGRKLWTKDPDKYNTALALLGQVATFECGVSEWQGDNGPVRSLWINAVNPGEPPPQEPPDAAEAVQAVAQEATEATEKAQEAPAQVQPTPVAQAPRQAFTEWDRQASIETQSALGRAVEYHAKDADATPEDVVKTATYFNAFLASKGVPF